MGGEERKAFQVGGDLVCGELEGGRGCWFHSPGMFRKKRV